MTLRWVNKSNQLETPVYITLSRDPFNASNMRLSRNLNNGINLTTVVINTTDTPELWNRKHGAAGKVPVDLSDLASRGNLLSSTTPKLSADEGGTNNHSGTEEALLNRSSVLFVAVSFVLLMVISLAWLVFYYVQRFRYLHSKERVSRRLAELAKKAVARIPVKTLHPGDKETLSDMDQCAICIEPYRPMDQLRILPCRHYFHKLCIDPWLLEQRSCPMCKLDILQAYGLRTDFYFNLTGAELPPGGTGHVSLLGAVQSGLASASGSDDGMERIALVHSSSLTTCPAPSLAYVVLSTTSASFASMNTSNTNENVTETTGLYYTHNSVSDLRVQPPLVQQHFVGPVTPLTKQVVVPVLPALAGAPSQLGPESTAGFFVWNGGLCAAFSGRTATSDIACDTHPTLSVTSNMIDGNVHALALQASTGSPSWPSSMMAANSKTKIPEVTSTTQAFTGPVCSVIAEAGGTDHSMTDGSKDRLIHRTAISSQTATEEAYPNPLDCVETVQYIHTNYTGEVFSTQRSLSRDGTSISGFPTSFHTGRTDSLPSRKCKFSRESSSRSRFHLPDIMSGINRLPFSSWLTPSWLSFRSGRSVPSEILSSADQRVLQPTITETTSAVPSDPLLRRQEHQEFPLSSHTALDFCSATPEVTQSKRAGTERVVVAVVETVPDRLQNSGSNDSDSSATDCAISHHIVDVDSSSALPD